MRDWTGSRIQADSLVVMCPWCKAAIGEPCTNEGQPLRAFPAHEVRIRLASKAASGKAVDA